MSYPDEGELVNQAKMRILCVNGRQRLGIDPAINSAPKGTRQAPRIDALMALTSPKKWPQ